MKQEFHLESLTAISPIDGRYRSKLEKLAPYFSEGGFMKYKVQVEVEYFIALCELPITKLNSIPKNKLAELRKIYSEFNLENAARIKEIELVTNHDVKAVEYFIKEKFDALGKEFAECKEFIHFGLTSQDINNTAVPMMLRDALQLVVIPDIEKVISILSGMAEEWKNVPMLARTHGQPASPTKMGKEILVFVERLNKQVASLKELKFPAKFGGATGNLNAHKVAFPNIEWHEFAQKFVNQTLVLDQSWPTTQIEHYDGLAAIFDNIKRINTILTDLCVDTWLYISTEYFTQRTVSTEVGSSAMPHKVNPIDFENAEGNLGFAISVFEFLSRKLPVSRLQRDLTDSTVMRNIGVAVSHSWLGILSVIKGLGKLQLNPEKISADLNSNWAVIAEAIQTIMRREGYPNPYEKLKEFTRGKKQITEEVIKEFIESLDVKEEIKEELRKITPWNYTGFA